VCENRAEIREVGVFPWEKAGVNFDQTWVVQVVYSRLAGVEERGGSRRRNAATDLLLLEMAMLREDF